MPIWLSVILCGLLGYMLGCINPAYIIARIRGFDIRSRGSGNAGASNAVITMGKAVGVFSALFDIFKAWLAVCIAVRCFKGLSVGDTLVAGEIAGVACVLGHMFPVFLAFRGGKGLACMGGMILYMNWKAFLFLLGGELLLVLVTDYICVAPLSLSAVFPIIRGIQTGSWAPAVILCVVIPAIWYKHAVNIRRIADGTEVHFSYLWNKESETDRISKKEEGSPSDSDTEQQNRDCDGNA